MTIDHTQAYFWTPRWQQGEQAAEEDLRAGRYQDFASMPALTQALQDDMREVGDTMYEHEFQE
ncbi:MAG: hypothetical protein AB1894_09400 [Chloroflexota bacterium]